MLNISYEFENVTDRLNVNSEIASEYCELLKNDFLKYYCCELVRPKLPNVQMKIILMIKDNIPIQFSPRKLISLN